VTLRQINQPVNYFLKEFLPWFWIEIALAAAYSPITTQGRYTRHNRRLARFRNSSVNWALLTRGILGPCWCALP